MKAFGTFFLIVLLSGCIAPKEIDKSACNDPKFLTLKMKIENWQENHSTMDSALTRTEWDYYRMKDAECEQAQAAANAVHQLQTGQSETVSLFIAIAVASALVLVLLK